MNDEQLKSVINTPDGVNDKNPVVGSKGSIARNPSPPPDDESTDTDLSSCLLLDHIDNTCFSRRWTLATLLKMIDSSHSETEKLLDNSLSEDYDDSSRSLLLSVPRLLTKDPDDFVDIPDEVQNEFCLLWDSSVNENVVKFLHENDGIKILISVAWHTHSPRLAEICVGILGNMMSSFDKIGKILTGVIDVKRRMIPLVWPFVNVIDTPVILESLRCLKIILFSSSDDSDNCLGYYLDLLDTNVNMIDTMTFLLQSHQNSEVLGRLAEILDNLFDESIERTIDIFFHNKEEDSDRDNFADTRRCPLLPSVFSAIKTLLDSYSGDCNNALNSLWHIVYLLSFVPTTDSDDNEICTRCRRKNHLLTSSEENDNKNTSFPLFTLPTLCSQFLKYTVVEVVEGDSYYRNDVSSIFAILSNILRDDMLIEDNKTSWINLTDLWMSVEKLCKHFSVIYRPVTSKEILFSDDDGDDNYVIFLTYFYGFLETLLSNSYFFAMIKKLEGGRVLFEGIRPFILTCPLSRMKMKNLLSDDTGLK